MANPWFPKVGVSGLNPTPALAGGSSSPILPHPSKPPDPPLPLDLSLFPPLSAPPSPLSPSHDSSQTALLEPERIVLALPARHVSRPVVITNPNLIQNLVNLNPRSEIPTTVKSVESPALYKPCPSAPCEVLTQGILPLPSTTMPLNTESVIDLVQRADSTITPNVQSPVVSTANVNSVIPPSSVSAQPPPVNLATKTWAQKLKRVADKSLERLAPLTFSPEGKPRVAISDSVFREGADLHKDFIIGRFKGRSPTFSHIQSVLSHMWGRGQRLEIHLNTLNNTMLVRIPNEFIRTKVLQKKLWYVGECMFLVAQWDSSGGATQDLDCIPIWAHLKGMPFDLMF